MSLISVNGIRINYVEFNSQASEVIIMVHGMFTNMAVFYFKIAQHLAEKYRVILYDLRGHGLSEVPTYGYELASMSNDLFGVMDAFDLPKAHIVGYSFGGLIALNAFLRHPERIQKLCVIEAPNPDNQEPGELLRHYSRNALELYTTALARSTGLKPSNRQLDKLDKSQQFLMSQSTLVNDMHVYEHFFQDIADAKIDKDILLLYGKHSVCLPSGEYLNRHITHSTLFVGEGDHNIPVQNPEWVSERLMSYFHIEPFDIK